MPSPLRAPLSPVQGVLLRVVSEPFLAAGEWPVWQYTDLTLDDQHGLDAATVLASLPEAGDRPPSSQAYRLIWRPDSYRQPQSDDQVTVTVAGLWYLPKACPLMPQALGIDLSSGLARTGQGELCHWSPAAAARSRASHRRWWPW